MVVVTTKKHIVIDVIILQHDFFNKCHFPNENIQSRNRCFNHPIHPIHATIQSSKLSSKMKFATFNPIPTSIINGSQSEDRNGRQLVIEVGDVGEIPKSKAKKYFNKSTSL